MWQRECACGGIAVVFLVVFISNYIFYYKINRCMRYLSLSCRRSKSHLTSTESINVELPHPITQSNQEHDKEIVSTIQTCGSWTYTTCRGYTKRKLCSMHQGTRIILTSTLVVSPANYISQHHTWNYQQYSREIYYFCPVIFLRLSMEIWLREKLEKISVLRRDKKLLNVLVSAFSQHLTIFKKN